ncbi:DUF6241 domain-containing protein [Planococcus sp. SSTMD024]|uniref:DUF6241 domain-containing protein n=1 Tax=Planococcus sp. SSTMD024 TaxID=3242163 RepID=UPI00351F1F42
MKTVLRTIIILVVGLGILAGAGYWAYKSLTSSDEQQISQAAEEADEKLQEDTEAPKPNELVETVGLSETEFQIHLHQMTHQKIEATEKRGAIEMTPERIDEMLKILQANEGAYGEYEFYEQSLTAWEKGDFSNAVNVHNTIWEWHKGTVGRATGLLSEEREAEFVKKHFQ